MWISSGHITWTGATVNIVCSSTNTPNRQLVNWDVNIWSNITFSPLTQIHKNVKTREKAPLHERNTVSSITLCIMVTSQSAKYWSDSSKLTKRGEREPADLKRWLTNKPHSGFECPEMADRRNRGGQRPLKDRLLNITTLTSQTSCRMDNSFI